MFRKCIRKFFSAETGAVTVDWVVLTATVVGLSAAVGTTVKTSIQTKANSISNSIAAAR